MQDSLKIADYNELPLISPAAGSKAVDARIRTARPQLQVDGGSYGPIPLSSPTLPGEHSESGGPQTVLVFVYRDANCELRATTEKPHAVAGEVCCLKVVGTSPAGAFLDWGIEQQILLPVSRQQKPLSIGQQTVVYLELDQNTERVIASSKLSRHLTETPDSLKPGNEVNLMISDSTNLGFKTVIDGHTLGLLYRNEVFQPLHVGQQLKGFVREIRDDGKVDVCLQNPAAKARLNLNGNELCDAILDHLARNKGSTTLTDKSPPEQIYQRFKVSKKVFKRAIGILYRERKILIEPERIVLADVPPKNVGSAYRKSGSNTSVSARENPWNKRRTRD